MSKKIYEEVELEVVHLSNQDVMIESGGDGFGVDDDFEY